MSQHTVKIFLRKIAMKTCLKLENRQNCVICCEKSKPLEFESNSNNIQWKMYKDYHGNMPESRK